jgi:predicted RNA-binding Zn ribbon-like protein
MIFAHDTEIALSAAAALVNTAPDPSDGSVEELVDEAALDAFLAEWQWTGIRTHDQAELVAVRKLRPRLARIWSVDIDEAADVVNELLRDFRALPQLVKHDGWDYHLHGTPSDVPLANRMAVEAAMAMTDVIRMDELSRLRLCAADDCNNVVVDLSKNRSRRYCEDGCGNRANVAAYRARRSQDADGG